ncbi:phage tail sheath C-terminal domain-containing protein [Streptomyces sp. WZ-12]|uniref:phage tail sheath C-terminal domain-containing protein n=1 Tax=Streptomyces sp. WZ-12 TaxID=3030210 RepID=UPI002381207A|nr:phage tail sheath C-terminal domain-containing protein [Streptomyces sp. WZ-12]
MRSIAGVSTSVPAFIGFTLTGPAEPTLVRSWNEFTDIYGPPPAGAVASEMVYTASRASSGYIPEELDSWRDIVAITAGLMHTVGVDKNGEVHYTRSGGDWGYIPEELDSWRDIVAITAGLMHTVGVDKNGEVHYTRSGGDWGYIPEELDSWRDIVAIAASRIHTVGVDKNGEVHYTRSGGDSGYIPEELDSWRDIVAIAAGLMHTVGVDKNGEVHYTRSGADSGYLPEELDSWRDIVAIAAGNYHTVGVDKNGEVHYTRSGADTGYLPEELDSWRDIVAIAAGNYHTVGVDKNGEVHYTRSGEDTGYIPEELDSWRDIVAIAAGEYHTVGVAHQEAGLTFSLWDAVYGFFSNGGGVCWVAGIRTTSDEGIVLPADELIERIIGESQSLPGVGLTALERVPEVTMVTIPDVWNIPGITEARAAGIWQKAAQHCANENRMVIMDPPKGANPDRVQAYVRELGLTDTDSRYAALYYPWVETSRGHLVPPSGPVSGVWCKADREKGVHKAPANIALQDVKALERELTDRDQDPLNAEGINCLRSFPGWGNRVWGARTLSKEDQWRYVNLRRLMNYLEESLKLGTRWAVFEPNDQQLRDTLCANVSQFLKTQWRSGALQGAIAREAFYVVCDESNNTPETIAAAKVICDVGVALVRPAEFIVFRISQAHQEARAV